MPSVCITLRPDIAPTISGAPAASCWKKWTAVLCGLARKIGREGESFRVLDLKSLGDTEADMFTTVFIGSSQTREIAGKMVTPRGYRK